MGNRLPPPAGEGSTTPNDRFARYERAARARPDPILGDRAPPAPAIPRRGIRLIGSRTCAPSRSRPRPEGAAAAALAMRPRDQRADTDILLISVPPTSFWLHRNCVAATVATATARTEESRFWQAQSDYFEFSAKKFSGSKSRLALCTQGLARPADQPRPPDSPPRRATTLSRGAGGEGASGRRPVVESRRAAAAFRTFPERLHLHMRGGGLWLCRRLTSDRGRQHDRTRTIVPHRPPRAIRRTANRRTALRASGPSGSARGLPQHGRSDSSEAA